MKVEDQLPVRLREPGDPALAAAWRAGAEAEAHFRKLRRPRLREISEFVDALDATEHLGDDDRLLEMVRAVYFPGPVDRARRAFRRWARASWRWIVAPNRYARRLALLIGLSLATGALAAFLVLDVIA